MSRNEAAIEFAKLIKRKTAENNVPQIPQNKHSVENGTVLMAENDYPFFGLAKGDMFPVLWDGEFVTNLAQSWSAESICNEIDEGYWSIKEIE